MITEILKIKGKNSLKGSILENAQLNEEHWMT